MFAQGVIPSETQNKRADKNHQYEYEDFGHGVAFGFGVYNLFKHFIMYKYFFLI